MKILRIIARLNVGGPARHVVWLTKELQDDEFQSVLIAGTIPEGEADMSYFAGAYSNPLFRFCSYCHDISIGAQRQPP